MPKAKTAYGNPAKAETAFVEAEKSATGFGATTKADTSYSSNPNAPIPDTYNEATITYADPIVFYNGIDPSTKLSGKVDTESDAVPKPDTAFAGVTKEQTGYN